MTSDRDPSGYRLFPPGVALMPEDFPQKAGGHQGTHRPDLGGDVRCPGRGPRTTLALAGAGGRTKRRSHAVPGAPFGTGAGWPGPAAGRRRDRNLQTEEVTE